MSLAVLWFFGVMVSEWWFGMDTAPRMLGGWTHNGPYSTRAACETARVKERQWKYLDDAHVMWHVPQPCFRESQEHWRVLQEQERETWRRLLEMRP